MGKRHTGATWCDDLGGRMLNDCPRAVGAPKHAWVMLALFILFLAGIASDFF